MVKGRCYCRRYKIFNTFLSLLERERGGGDIQNDRKRETRKTIENDRQTEKMEGEIDSYKLK